MTHPISGMEPGYITFLAQLTWNRGQVATGGKEA